MKNTKSAKLLLLLPALVLSSCASPLSVEEVATRTDAMILALTGDEEASLDPTWVAPTAFTFEQTGSFLMTFTGEEDYLDESYTKVVANPENGYFAVNQTMYGESIAFYAFVDGSNYYLAMDDGTDKMYATVALPNNEKAVEFAVAQFKANATIQGIYEPIAYECSGESSLFAVQGWCAQYISLHNEDPEDDYVSGYAQYDITFKASAVGETAYNCKIELDAYDYQEDTEAGMYSEGSVVGTLVANFTEEGWLTHALDDSVLLEEEGLIGGTEEEVMAMSVVSRQETKVSYKSAKHQKHDLTGFTLIEA